MRSSAAVRSSLAVVRAHGQLLLDRGERYDVQLGLLAGRGRGEQQAGDAAFGALAGGA
ncbi:hypothetical protein AB0894_32260 [Streptomyces sp. NPDC047916]|uniref:hypothetical protein n=1 Tax=Streptomyces sp. NPDC047916 TaxID=3156681 RepID=UPI0034529C40